MTRRNISSGSHFEAAYGYSRAVVTGSQAFVSGTVGMNYATGTIDPDAAMQVRQIVTNIEAALAQADFGRADIVQLTTYIAGAELMPAVGAALGEAFGDIRPANTVVVVGFPVPGVLVEISAVAVRG
jgi:enamine deaminase RidA (YjgF/YER057c/UK114 family)